MNMALYADKTKVNLSNQPDKYGVERSPGETPPDPGIYKCQSCGYEDVINRECSTLPPCSECKKKTTTWKLLVKAENK